MLHPKEIGDRTTIAVMLALKLQGHTLLVPFGENARYDLVVDEGHRLTRLQCKTGWLRDGVVHFATCSSYAHHPHPRSDRKRNYRGEIDEFAVFCPELGAVYRIPIEDVPTERRGTLRVDAPRNGQLRNVRLAALYEIARIDVY